MKRSDFEEKLENQTHQKLADFYLRALLED